MTVKEAITAVIIILLVLSTIFFLVYKSSKSMKEEGLDHLTRKEFYTQMCRDSCRTKITQMRANLYVINEITLLRTKGQTTLNADTVPILVNSISFYEERLKSDYCEKNWERYMKGQILD